MTLLACMALLSHPRMTPYVVLAHQATILISSLIPLQSRPHHKLYTDRVPWAYQHFTSQLGSSPSVYNYTQRIAKLYINIIDPGHRGATRSRPQPSFATTHDVTRPLVSRDRDTRVASTEALTVVAKRHCR